MGINRLKKKAYELLKKLKNLTDKNDKGSYLKLKKDFQALMPLLFGPNYVKNNEYNIWDLARNQLDNIFTFRMQYDSQRMAKGDYENYRRMFEKKFAELMESIEREL